MTKDIDTFHTRTIIDDELGGRFARKAPTVVGKTPTPYPQQPDNSPWSKNTNDVEGREPPLGAVDEVGEGLGECVAVSPSDVSSSSSAVEIGDHSPKPTQEE